MSRVIVAEAWPSIVWTTFTSTPLAMARLAAVWRNSCGCRLGIPMATAAAPKAVRNVETRSGWPFANAAEHEVIGILAYDKGGEIVDQKARDGDLATPMRLRGTPDQPLRLDGCHGLGHDRAAARECLGLGTPCHADGRPVGDRLTSEVQRPATGGGRRTREEVKAQQIGASPAKMPG
jgi:hypothetical protein